MLRIESGNIMSIYGDNIFLNELSKVDQEKQKEAEGQKTDRDKIKEAEKKKQEDQLKKEYEEELNKDKENKTEDEEQYDKWESEH